MTWSRGPGRAPDATLAAKLGRVWGVVFLVVVAVLLVTLVGKAFLAPGP